MGYQIIKQPDLKFSIWSSNTEKLICVDGTEDEVVEFFVEIAAKDAKYRTLEIIEQINNGENPYHQFARKWEDLEKL